MEVSTYHKYYGCPDFIFYSGKRRGDSQRVEEARIMLRKILVLPTLEVGVFEGGRGDVLLI